MKTKYVLAPGQKYNRLTVVEPAEERYRWICRCDCGTEKAIYGWDLGSGNTRSCGCLQREVTAKRNYTHGLSYSREYSSWSNMLVRCYNPNHLQYADYGGRGIQVYPPWRTSFAEFYDYVGPRPTPQHSLDRINNDGNYEPENVKWSTRSEQGSNTSKTRLIEFNGEVMPVKHWAKRVGVDRRVIANRLKRGKSVEEAFGLVLKEGKGARV